MWLLHTGKADHIYASFTHIEVPVQVAVLDNVTSIGKILSPDSRHALAFVEGSPAEAAPVVRAFAAGLLTQTGGAPPPPLVDAAMKAYARSKDAELLALVIPGLPGKQALEFLGPLVALPLERFRAAVQALVARPGGGGTVHARELLTRLHLVNTEALHVCTFGPLAIFVAQWCYELVAIMCKGRHATVLLACCEAQECDLLAKSLCIVEVLQL